MAGPTSPNGTNGFVLTSGGSQPRSLHERAIKPYGLEVSKTLRKDSRDSLGLSLKLSIRAFYIYGRRTKPT